MKHAPARCGHEVSAQCGVRLLMLAAMMSGCGDVPETATAPASLAVRAERRAFRGAPPVIPHPPLTGTCVTCHTPEGGKITPGIGVAPANPHTKTQGIGAAARCRQCHVFRQTEKVFVDSEFAGLRRDGVRGERAHALAPPMMPHSFFMREDCLACHGGGGARPEIRCTHPERARCAQCHVGVVEGGEFEAVAGIEIE
jgi:cytochrome c-type protein NapB